MPWYRLGRLDTHIGQPSPHSGSFEFMEGGGQNWNCKNSAERRTTKRGCKRTCPCRARDTGEARKQDAVGDRGKKGRDNPGWVAVWEARETTNCTFVGSMPDCSDLQNTKPYIARCFGTKNQGISVHE